MEKFSLFPSFSPKLPQSEDASPRPHPSNAPENAGSNADEFKKVPFFSQNPENSSPLTEKEEGITPRRDEEVDHPLSPYGKTGAVLSMLSAHKRASDRIKGKQQSPLSN